MSAGGSVRGILTVEAERASARNSPWEYRALKLEVDKVALDERQAQRRAIALQRYGAAAVAASQAASEAAAGRTAAAASADSAQPAAASA